MTTAATTTRPEEAAALLSEGFFQTDNQTHNHQYVKRLSAQQYLIAQENAATSQFETHEVNLADYTLEEIRRYVNGYYDSIQQAFESYSRDATFTCQVIAELIAEQDVGY